MKKIVPLILVAFLPFAAFSQQGYKQDLDHIAVITFPDTTKATTKDDETIYALNESRIVYLAAITHIDKGVKDLLNKNSNDSLYDGLISGSMENSKSRLLYKKHIEAAGLDGVEFAYSADEDSVISYRYHQAFYLNNTAILLGYWSIDSLKADDKGMRSFFGSFKLKIKPDEVRQGNSDEIAFNIGKIIGYLLIPIVVIGLGLGIVFLLSLTRFGDKPLTVRVLKNGRHTTRFCN